MSGRKQIDWERIEKLFIAGQLSICEIARQHGITEGAIRQKAKKLGWTRDLDTEVRRQTKEKLLRSSLRSRNAQTDAEIVNEAADMGVAVVLSHRRDIQSGRAICGMLLSELKDGTEHNVLLSEIVSQQADENEWSDKAKAAANRAISLPSRAGVMRDLATSMKTLQALERKAFGIDDDKRTERDALEEILEAVSDTSRGIDGYSNGD